MTDLTCYRCSRWPCECADGCAIAWGDCVSILSAMRDDSLDCCVTSPPYNQLGKRIPKNPTGGFGSERLSGWMQKVGQVGYGDDMPEGEYQSWLCGIVGNCLRVARGLVWVNHKIRYRNREALHPVRYLPYPVYSEVIWDRGSSIALNCRKYAPSHESIWGFGKPHYWNRKHDMKRTVWRISAHDRGVTGHPCDYPIDLVSPLIESSCPESGIVLDPFMGSGTTLIAAKQLGRKAIGIEIEEKYCEIAANRLANEPMPLFTEVAV